MPVTYTYVYAGLGKVFETAYSEVLAAYKGTILRASEGRTRR